MSIEIETTEIDQYSGLSDHDAADYPTLDERKKREDQLVPEEYKGADEMLQGE